MTQRGQARSHLRSRRGGHWIAAKVAVIPSALVHSCWGCTTVRARTQTQPNQNLSNVVYSGLNAPSLRVLCPCGVYVAFLDPVNGRVNLVVEYMDGGSLEDVVQAGGCQREDVLLDILNQATLGLTFLHDQKQIHR